MDKKAINKTKVFFAFFIGLLLIEILFTHHFKNQNNKDKIFNTLNNFVNTEINTLNSTLQEIVGMDSLQLDENTRNLYSQKEREYLIYKNNLLIDWTDNRIAVPVEYDSAKFSQHIDKLNNAYCLVAKDTIEDYVVIGLSILKKDYPYENEYLSNSFNKQLDIPDKVQITENQSTGKPVRYDGKEIFNVEFPETLTLTSKQHKILFALFVIVLIFLFAFLYHGHKYLNPFPSKPRVYVLFYTLDIVIVRVLIAWLEFPEVIYESALFDPSILGMGRLLPSLGDMFLTAISLLAILLAVYKNINLKLPVKSVVVAILINAANFLFLILIIKGMQWLIQSMVINSSIMLNLHEVFSVNFYTIVAFISLFVFLAGIYLIISKVFNFIKNHNKPGHAAMAFGLALSVYILTTYFVNGSVDWLALSIITSILIVFFIQRYYLKKLNTTFCLTINLIIFSAVITFLLQYQNKIQEQEKRKVGAVKIASKQDPVAESMFLDIEKNIYKDDTLQVLINNKPLDEDLIISYILYRYFRGYWEKYNFQTTICKPNDNLVFGGGNIENCDTFFDNMINEAGHFTFSENLFYLDNNPWFSSYIARLPFNRDSNQTPVTIYIEMNAKFAPEGLVYPELLIDDNIQRSELFSTGYSLAKYQNDELLASIGEFSYTMSIRHLDYSSKEDKHFFEQRGYHHYFYPVNGKEVLVISKKIPGFWESLAPFAFILVFLTTFLLVFTIIIKPDILKRFHNNFKVRLQFVLFSVVLISFILIGVLSVNYLKEINQKKNTKLLKEKSHSILIEVEHKLLDVAEIDSSMYTYVNDLMFKFASVFFTDINMYNTQGMLIATSRPEIYEKGLVSRQMNSEILYKLRSQEQTVILHKEKLGELEYSSAYMPFRNQENKVIAYLNIPYYAKQSELEEEITDFLATFINIYVILLAIALALALLLTGYITRPLNLIKEQMRKVKLGASNEKILWKNSDEIGELIKEYNKMIDELERSTDLLMRSQRESAWREMAKQVAHEIKNPLTPMKLNVQMLKRTWDPNDPDWKNKLNKVTNSLIEQIDNLASIASEFSDFAKMPVSRPEIVDLNEVITHSIELYSNYEDIRIFLENNVSDTRVKADFKHLTRVFNNILDNAVNSIPKEKTGRIDVKINQKTDSLIVSIKDNGRGIPVEMKGKIFSPSFTTKSSGMGLGLTMVKSIVNNAGGRIWFDSIENEGTTFYVELPQIKS
ncbi:MAG: GHKL domain-containing protein [Bacteroidales bacterium]|nr:GHKL domain-containing protein [Bacteroidales bacterium]